MANAKLTPDEGTIRRIQKLIMFAEQAGGNEADNAKNILEILLEKYDVDLAAMGEREEHAIAIDHRMVDAVVQLASSMGLSIYSREKERGNGKWYYVNANDVEYNAFRVLFDDLKSMFRQRLNAAIREAAGYVYGFAMKCYPTDDADAEPTPCPRCKNPMVYDDSRWQCPECGSKGKKSRRQGPDRDAAGRGYRAGAKKLTST